MLNRNFRVLQFLIAFAIPFVGNAQLTVDETLTPEQVVEDILLGTGVQAFNITYSGNMDQVGSFECNNCGVGIESGVMLSSGNINVGTGPNDSGSATEGGGNFGANDIDLDAISTFGTNDAAILEFDFITTGDSVKFNYVFGSEEYNEYVCGSVNDAFGFFLSGPGIAGPFSNNAINLAEIPGTDIPVTINTVNNGTVGSNGTASNCEAVSPDWNQNSEYYVDNANNPDPITVQFDGHTVVLTAAAEVICGETYHIKIAIADGGDTAFDSGVFLQESSFTSNEVLVDLVIADVGVNDSTIYEGCGEAYFLFTRPSNGIPDELTFELNLGGTAEAGIDYEDIPTTITFPYDVYELEIPFAAFNDGVFEGTELVTVSYLSEDACSGDVELQVENFYIQDVADIEILMEDQEINCGDIASIIPELSGGYGMYSYEWSSGEEEPNIDVAPTYPDGGTYTLTVTDTCGFGPFSEEVVISYPDYPDLTVDAGPDQLINCLGDLEISPDIQGGYPPYSYSWLDQYENELSTEQDLAWQPDEAGDVVIVVTDLCDINNSDTVAFAFPPIPVDVDLGPDQDVTCIDIITLEGNVNGGVGQGGFTYEWSSDGAVLGDEPTLDVQVDSETTFTLTAEDLCGNIGSDDVILSVPAVPVNVDLGPDFDVTCIDVTTLQPAVDGGVGDYSFQWTEDGNDAGSTESIEVTISDQTVYEVTVEDECGNINSDLITLSVPPVPIDVDLGPDLVVVCVDTTLLESEVTGGVGNYSYLWEEGYDSLSTSTSILFNTEVSTVVSLTIEDECENIGYDEIELNIPSEPIYLDVTADTTLCPGDSLVLSASASGGQGGYSYLWMPSFTTDTIWNNTYYNSQVIEVYAQDVCGNNTTESINVNVEEVYANFDFVYLDEWHIQTYNSSVPENSYYFWDMGDGEFSAEFEPSHTYYSLDPYTITLSITTERGCVDTISREFQALMDVYIPSAFTPNQDGINDVFRVEGRNVAEFELWIFNRWGEEIHHSTDINEVWTGGFNGGEHYVQNEVYTYRIRAVGTRGRTIEKSGTVTIIR